MKCELQVHCLISQSGLAICLASSCWSTIPKCTLAIISPAYDTILRIIKQYYKSVCSQPMIERDELIVKYASSINLGRSKDQTTDLVVGRQRSYQLYQPNCIRALYIKLRLISMTNWLQGIISYPPESLLFFYLYNLVLGSEKSKLYNDNLYQMESKVITMKCNSQHVLKYHLNYYWQ